jgi:hypothetical protein
MTFFFSHNMASALIVQALQKGPCSANQIAYTDIGSADNLVEQGPDLKNTAILVAITRALKVSSRPDAILF